MVPRAWEFRVASPSSVLHGALGLLIGVLLIVKIAVIRRFRRFGNRLPWIGSTLSTTTLLMAGAGRAAGVDRGSTAGSALSRTGPGTGHRLSQVHPVPRCFPHRLGARDAREWQDITRRMQGYSRQFPGKEAITEDE